MLTVVVTAVVRAVHYGMVSIVTVALVLVASSLGFRLFGFVGLVLVLASFGLKLVPTALVVPTILVVLKPLKPAQKALKTKNHGLVLVRGTSSARLVLM